MRESIQQELMRIEKLAAEGGLCNFDFETRTEEPYQLLTSALLHLEPSFFRRSDRQTTKQLLGSAMKEKAMLLSKFVCSSGLRDHTKWIVSGEVESFLKKVCNVGTDEIIALRKACSFDPTDGTHDIFAGLED
jgi:hypothetical protein